MHLTAFREQQYPLFAVEMDKPQKFATQLRWATLYPNILELSNSGELEFAVSTATPVTLAGVKLTLLI